MWGDNERRKMIRQRSMVWRSEASDGDSSGSVSFSKPVCMLHPGTSGETHTE